MTLAGVWRQNDGPVTMYIDGREPSYTFRAETPGLVVSQGVIQQLGDGTYHARGQGIGGPVKIRWRLAQPNVLQGQNEVLIDGGPVDGLMALFMPGFAPGLAALQPTMTFLRQQQVVPIPEQLPKEDDTDRAAQEKAAKIIAAASAHAAREKEREEQERRKSKNLVPESAEDPMEELHKLIGMAAVKMQVEQLDAWAWRERELRAHEIQTKVPSLHMCFSGGPGTGKTTVARIIGGLLKKYELLKHGRVQEVGRADLVAEFVGQTATKTEKLVEDAIGGVLFIDEAYALSEPGAGGGSRDYGAEALAVLIAGMENHRHELCIIVAGYPAEMERFINANAGLASRVSRHINFPDFTDQELQEVFEAMAAAYGLKLDPKILASFQSYIRRAKAAAKPRQWGNARTVRNILERGIENQSVRLRKAGRKPSRDQLLRLELVDFAFFSSSDVTIN
jgi:AAA+ superfamily predicted ATPase